MAKTVAVQGDECIQQLTGPERERHTNQLANVLNTEDGANAAAEQCENVCRNETSLISLSGFASTNNKETRTKKVNDENNSDDKDDVEIVNPEVTVIASDPMPEVLNLEDPHDRNASQSRYKTLMKDIKLMRDPVVSITPIDVQSQTLVVQDDIDIKKEQLGSSKFIPFSVQEDTYLMEGYAKFGKKWHDILKHSEYIFHTSRNRESLRGRHKTLVRRIEVNKNT